jgi:hypothetical protein
MQDQTYGNYENSEARSFGFAYGLLVGTALGAAVALLFAPKPGSELRGQLADATSRIRQRAGRCITARRPRWTTSRAARGPRLHKVNLGPAAVL